MALYYWNYDPIMRKKTNKKKKEEVPNQYQPKSAKFGQN
jgi:hypothetical protein